MNTVSLFLYVADVIMSLKIALVIITGVISGLILLHIVLIAIHNDDCKRYYPEKSKPYPNVYKQLSIPAALVIFIALIPSQQAMYLIAGSEIGEVVVTSPEGREVFNETKDAILRVIRNIGEETK